MGTKDLADGTGAEITDELLSPCTARRLTLKNEADESPDAVIKRSRWGQLEGLTVLGCEPHYGSEAEKHTLW